MADTALSVWPPLPPSTVARRRARSLPWPLDDPGCRLFRRARQALFHGVTSLSLPPDATILVPAYHHGSEVEALVRAGISVRFYGLTAGLEPDREALEAALDPTVAALYLIHYIGFPQDSARWRAWADDHGVLLFEDVAQSWLSARDGTPAGAFGDLAIFCLYKSFGVPDGGALVGRAVAGAPSGEKGPIGAGAALLRTSAWLASRSAAVATVAAARARRRHARAAQIPETPGELDADMRLDPRPIGPSRSSMWLLPRVFDPRAPARRRDNYRALLERLAPAVPEPLRVVPEGAAPWVFPIAVTHEKEAAFLRLRERRIDAVHLWKFAHPLLDGRAFPSEARLRDTLIGLPVHQELRAGDLDRIAGAAEEVLARA